MRGLRAERLALTAAATGVAIALLAPPSTAAIDPSGPAPLPLPKPIRTGQLVAAIPQAPVPFEYRKNGYILFKVRLAEREVWAMLDTGAQGSAIDSAFARDNGLAIEKTAGTVELYSGKTALEAVRDVPLLIPGQFETRVPQLAVVDMSRLSASVGEKVQFVLGEDGLRNLFVMVNPEKKTVQFGPSGRLTPPAGAPFIALKDGQPHLEAEIGGKPVTLLVDLGSAYPFTLSPEAWARLGPETGALDAKVERDEQGREMRLVRVPQVKVGPASAANAPVVIRSLLARPGVDGTLGNAFFHNKLLVIDQKAGKLWVLPSRAGQPAP